jgi:hypothetical protein
VKRLGTFVVSLFLSATFGNAQVANNNLRSFETASNFPITFANASSVEALPIAPSKLTTVAEPQKVANKSFWLVNAYQVIWTVADIETTASNLSKNSYCREMNPLVGSRPSRTVLYLSNLPIMAGAGYLSYRAKKKQGRFWYLLPSIAGSAHAAGTVWNMTGSSC